MPSSTAAPNGRVSLVPPRNMFQIVSPNAVACASDEKLAAPVAPPSESVTILPLDWHVWMSDARKEQSASAVPGKTVSSTALQMLAKSSEGAPPVPEKTFTNASGIASIVSSCVLEMCSALGIVVARGRGKRHT